MLQDVKAGGDRDLRFVGADRDALRAKISHFQPRYLCFNGKRSATEFLGRARLQYGLQGETIGRTALFAAPSTSSAANASWDLSAWQELADLLRARGDRA